MESKLERFGGYQNKVVRYMEREFLLNILPESGTRFLVKREIL